MRVPKQTRRQFVRDAAVSTAAAFVALDATAAASAASGGHPDDLMTGVVTGVTGPRSASVSVRGRGPARVVLVRGAFIDQGFVGPIAGHDAVSDLSSFRVGEEVAIRGRQSGTVVTATEFQSIYREMRGEILTDNGEELQTSAGAMRLPARVRQLLGIGRLAAGERFSANVWIDPATGEAIAAGLATGRA